MKNDNIITRQTDNVIMQRGAYAINSRLRGLADRARFSAVSPSHSIYKNQCDPALPSALRALCHPSNAESRARPN